MKMHLLWEIMGGGPPKVALRLGINWELTSFTVSKK